MNEFKERRQRATQYTPELAEVRVRLPQSRREATVSVRGPELRFGGVLVPAEVNWSALGSTSQADAQVYANAILHAATVVLPTLEPAGAAEKLMPREGCDRCECGCKYWEGGRCIDCGTVFRPEHEEVR